MTNKEYALLAGKVLSDKKAQDIVIVDIQEKATFADYFVICSGGSERQVRSLASELSDKLAEEGIFSRSVEGRGPSGWILMDYGDIVINVFSQEQRGRYNIEKVWGDGIFLDIE